YHILVYLLYKAAVRPGGAIETHFRRIHYIKGETLKAIKQLRSSWTLRDLMNIAPLDDSSKVIAELAAQWGYSCKSYIYITISHKNALTHCAQHKPRISKANAPAWKERTRYWIVRAYSNSDSTIALKSAAINSIMDRMIANSKAELLEEDTKKNEHSDRQEGINYDLT
ncbi:hypothetical protein B0J13DRAFT_453557, partial [Dactylonectria estremocensis]